MPLAARPEMRPQRKAVVTLVSVAFERSSPIARCEISSRLKWAPGPGAEQVQQAARRLLSWRYEPSHHWGIPHPIGRRAYKQRQQALVLGPRVGLEMFDQALTWPPRLRATDGLARQDCWRQ